MESQIAFCYCISVSFAYIRKPITYIMLNRGTFSGLLWFLLYICLGKKRQYFFVPIIFLKIKRHQPKKNERSFVKFISCLFCDLFNICGINCA